MVLRKETQDRSAWLVCESIEGLFGPGLLAVSPARHLFPMEVNKQNVEQQMALA